MAPAVNDDHPAARAGEDVVQQLWQPLDRPIEI